MLVVAELHVLRLREGAHRAVKLHCPLGGIRLDDGQLMLLREGDYFFELCRVGALCIS